MLLIKLLNHCRYLLVSVCDTDCSLAGLGFPQTRESGPDGLVPEGQLFSGPLHHFHLGPPQLIPDRLVQPIPLGLVVEAGVLLDEVHHLLLFSGRHDDTLPCLLILGNCLFFVEGRQTSTGRNLGRNFGRNLINRRRWRSCRPGTGLLPLASLLSPGHSVGM